MIQKWDQLSMTSLTRMLFLPFIGIIIFSNIAVSSYYVPWQSLPNFRPRFYSWSRLVKKRSLSKDRKCLFLILVTIFLRNWLVTRGPWVSRVSNYLQPRLEAKWFHVMRVAKFNTAHHQVMIRYVLCRSLSLFYN